MSYFLFRKCYVLLFLLSIVKYYRICNRMKIMVPVFVPVVVAVCCPTLTSRNDKIHLGISYVHELLSFMFSCFIDACYV